MSNSDHPVNHDIYDSIVIGGGPAGAAAAVYAARKKMKTLLVTEGFGGQSLTSPNIENWIGTIGLTGLELARALEAHARAQKSVEVKAAETVVSVSEIPCLFQVLTKKGDVYITKTVIVASGGRRRRLGIPGENELEGKGVAYCSTCDAPLFSDQTVAVIGGGNTALETVIDLVPYARRIYLVSRRPELRGDPSTEERVRECSKVTFIQNAQPLEILGDGTVTHLKYEDKVSHQERELSVNGIFVEIGSVPNSEMVKDLVERNPFGEIVVDPKTCATSKPGIFAAGDVTDEIYKQNNIAAGDAVRAALSAYNYLLNINQQSPCADLYATEKYL